jgi:hypothetical protein
MVSAARAGKWMPALVCAAALASGCKSDFNQQLLERELRMQEDQIYHLQDELQVAGARIDSMASENISLKKQLGIADGGPTVPSAAPDRFQPTPAPASVAPPVLVPPTVDDVPPPAATLPPPAVDGPRFGPPGDAAPSFRSPAAAPVLEGVPPLPDEPVVPPAGASGARAGADPAVRPVTHEESLAVESTVTHLVINRDRTQAFDGDGDGMSDGLAIVFEPRDADERLVMATGDVLITVYEPVMAGPSGEGACIARWEVPAAEAASQFRRTSRARGVHLVQRWPGPPPSGPVRVFVEMTTFAGKSFAADATVSVK